MAELANTLSNCFRFLNLPRELRGLVYEHYFRADGGYIHHFRSNKLTRADGGRINLDLFYVCRQINAEMSSDCMPFCVNKITFRTYWSEDTHDRYVLYTAYRTAPG